MATEKQLLIDNLLEHCYQDEDSTSENESLITILNILINNGITTKKN
jgi:hypothetical protein